MGNLCVKKSTASTSYSDEIIKQKHDNNKTTEDEVDTIRIISNITCNNSDHSLNFKSPVKFTSSTFLNTITTSQDPARPRSVSKHRRMMDEYHNKQASQSDDLHDSERSRGRSHSKQNLNSSRSRAGSRSNDSISANISTSDNHVSEHTFDALTLNERSPTGRIRSLSANSSSHRPHTDQSTIIMTTPTTSNKHITPYNTHKTSKYTHEIDTLPHIQPAITPKQPITFLKGKDQLKSSVSREALNTMGKSTINTQLKTDNNTEPEVKDSTV